MANRSDDQRKAMFANMNKGSAGKKKSRRLKRAKGISLLRLLPTPIRKEIDITRISPPRPEVVREHIVHLTDRIDTLDMRKQSLETDLHYETDEVMKKGIRASLKDLADKRKKQHLLLSKEVRDLEKAKKVWSKVGWYTKERERGANPSG